MSIALARWIVIPSEAFGSIELSLYLIAMAPAFAVGYLVSILASSSSLLIRMLGYCMAAVLLVVSVLTFSYFKYFGQLPGSGAFYYLSELDKVAPSIIENVPFLWIGFGVLILLLLLLALHRSGAYDRKASAEPLHVRAVGVLALLATIGLGALPQTTERWRASASDAIQDPLVWLLVSGLRKSFSDVPENMPASKLFLDLQRFVGHAPPFAALTLDAPLCGASLLSDRANGRSVIFLMLESVSTVHMDKRVDGKWLMPNLQAIVKAPESILFSNFFAVGTKSNQAMVAAFSGLPPQVDTHILWQTPLPLTESLVGALRSDGYRTAYFHGSDLSFEQQRVYLHQAGFDELFEPGPEKPHKVIGWGYDDGVMFDVVRSWIEAHRSLNGSSPYISALATLTTHDPYFIPEAWSPKSALGITTAEFRADWSKLWREDHAARELESFRYLDHQLGGFYRWYEQFEKPRGTLLILVGDHVPASIYKDPERTVVERYAVPFIITGEGISDKDTDYSIRVGSQFDIHRTLTSLVGRSPEPCDQGLDLLMPGEKWKQDRLVYAVDGDFNELAMFADSWAAKVDRNTGTLSVEMRQKAFPLAGKSVTEAHARQQALSFVNTVIPVSRYVASIRGYSTRVGAAGISRSPIIRGDEPPIVVAHRGNSRGVGHGKLTENSREALNQAITDGFGWAEIDIQITRDGVPVVHHDDAVEFDGKNIPISGLALHELRQLPCCLEIMTLGETIKEFAPHLDLLVEAKHQKYVWQSMAMEDAIVQLILDSSEDSRFIIDSFSDKSAAAIRRNCKCEGGWDAPQHLAIDQDLLQHVVNLGLDWVYLDKSQVDANVVRMAHEYGLKVMVYTINDPVDLARWGVRWPEGIISDDIRIRLAVDEHFKSLGANKKFSAP